MNFDEIDQKWEEIISKLEASKLNLVNTFIKQIGATFVSFFDTPREDWKEKFDSFARMNANFLVENGHLSYIGFPKTLEKALAKIHNAQDLVDLMVRK